MCNDTSTVMECEKKLLSQYREMASRKDSISEEMYAMYDVQRGLRDKDGKGVLVGLTEIGEIRSYDIVDGEMVSKPGKLIYRGMEINDIVDGFMSEGRYGFEETCYLLLFGGLPNKAELEKFQSYLSERRCLPNGFAADMIMKSPGRDIMNMLARSVLGMYSYDDAADDISIENVLKQCISLISYFPMLTVHSYMIYKHYHQNSSLILHSPKPEYATAENILHMLRPDSAFTRLEAELLDLALVLHAEHGGGNNSSFTTHVLTSIGTDTYSVIAAALGSLKGPMHGGANIKVVQMIEDLKSCVKNLQSDLEIEAYLQKVLKKETFDRLGKIYGMGHAVYTISDPRAIILRERAEALAKEKGFEEDFELYTRIERIAPGVIMEGRKRNKGICANIDLYSGLLYKMLQIPLELFTPIFAISRISGWSAHRIEELVNGPRIIRPAYKCVAPEKEYVPLCRR